MSSNNSIDSIRASKRPCLRSIRDESPTKLNITVARNTDGEPPARRAKLHTPTNKMPYRKGRYTPMLGTFLRKNSKIPVIIPTCNPEMARI